MATTPGFDDTAELVAGPLRGSAPRGARTAEWLIIAAPLQLAELASLAPTRTTVRIVNDAGGFRDALTSDRPRLAVLCMPPGDDAELELLSAERRRRPGLRAVLLNAHDDVDHRLAALRLGFDACLEAEMDVRELAERLRLLAQESVEAGRDHRVPIADGVELDLDGHQLVRDGAPVHLRPREFALLEFLARHPWRTYSRTSLLARVWGSDRDIDPRTVDVHVRWLREKVEADPERPIHLTTVRGVGYRLVPGER